MNKYEGQQTTLPTYHATPLGIASIIAANKLNQFIEDYTQVRCGEDPTLNEKEVRAEGKQLIRNCLLEIIGD